MKSGVVIGFLLAVQVAWGQNFGKNKPLYDRLDFGVFRTEHFDIYAYMENPAFRDQIAKNAEQWYRMHSAILRDSFTRQNPIILYNNHPDFQQTTAISGSIGESTGGVTESLKNRVVFPVLFSNQQTGHVLGHELVHAFQYHLVSTFNKQEVEEKEKLNNPHQGPAKGGEEQEKSKGNSKSDSTVNMTVQDQKDTVYVLEDPQPRVMDFRSLPLWMVEGMAEYLSIGREDPFTAMWMRDAVASNNIPTIKDLQDYSRYFPYRWGHMFWAFVVSRYGESMLRQLFIETGQYGLDKALIRNFGMDTEAFSKVWRKHLTDYYGDLKQDFPADSLSHHLVAGGEDARIYVGPAVSPNGQYVAFFSEREVFSIDLYLADLSTGEIVKKLTSINRSQEVDAVSSVEATVTWAPDNSHIAYVATSKGKNVLVVQDVFAPKRKQEYFLEGVPAFTSPAWSPDGKYIVVSGLSQGQIDLYSLVVNTGETIQVTNDKYSELLPSWSPDGHKVIYSTDRRAFEKGRTLGNLNYNLEILDLETGTVSTPAASLSGDQLNPLFGPSNERIWFISTHDGYRDLYSYELRSGETYRETRYWTGISGITSFAPAVSISRKGDLLYTLYSENHYKILKAKEKDFLHLKLEDHDVNKASGILPLDTLDVISKAIKDLSESSMDSAAISNIPYKPHFKIDYIGGEAGVGIANSSLGTVSGLNGGVNMLMGDILGYQQVFVGAALNGQIQDAALQGAYINQKGRLPWGISVSHIPYRSGATQYVGVSPIAAGEDTVMADHFVFDQYRTFEDKLAGSVYYPLSVANRLELSGSLSYYYSSYKRYHAYYFGPVPVKWDEEKLSGFDPTLIGKANVAYVHDDSYFGMTAPSAGGRYRFEAGRYFGAYEFNTFLADYRRYWFIKPITLAARGMHYGRYGNVHNLSPLFIGHPGMVRGYSFSRLVNTFQDDRDFSVNQLIGSKIGLTSFEVRLPFTGSKRLALIPSRFWYSDLALFFDAGLAWSDYYQLKRLGEKGIFNGNPADPLLVGSVGVSYRINLGGAVILEPYYSIPLNKHFSPGFGFNFFPGW